MHGERTSIYDLKALKALNIDPSKLGYVGLEFTQKPFKYIYVNKLYYSRDPRLTHVQEQKIKSHVTLKYGLLEHSTKWFKENVNEVLSGWEPRPLFVTHFASFNSQIKGEDYSCIYADVSKNSCLYDANQRLSMLPHIDTQDEYIPHVTVAYVRKMYEEETLRELNEMLSTSILVYDNGSLDYGDK